MQLFFSLLYFPASGSSGLLVYYIAILVTLLAWFQPDPRHYVLGIYTCLKNLESRVHMARPRHAQEQGKQAIH